MKIKRDSTRQKPVGINQLKLLLELSIMSTSCSQLCIVNTMSSMLWVLMNKSLDERMKHEDFSGGLVVKNLPANAGEMGSIPGLGRFHMPWGS